MNLNNIKEKFLNFIINIKYIRLLNVLLSTLIPGVVIIILLNAYIGTYYKMDLMPNKKGLFPAIILLVLLIILKFLIRSRIKESYRPNRITRIVHGNRWIALILLLVLVFSFYTMYKFSWNIAKDAFLHYVYLHSLFFDGDLHFSNNYEPMGGPSFFLVHETGYWMNPFSIGSSVFWFPFFLTGHFYAKMVGIPADGYAEFPYIFSLNLGGLLLAWFGLVLLTSVLQRYFKDNIALISALVIWYATPLTFYTNQQPFFSHALSFFFVTFFLFNFFRVYERSTMPRWMILGISTGMMMLVRPQNIIFAIIPIIFLVKLYFQKNDDEKAPNRADVFKCGSLYVLFTLATFLPQMIIWQIMYGSPFTIPQGKTFMEWGNPKILKILFSTNHGLFTWTPILLLAFMGLFIFIIKDKLVGISMLTAFLLMVYVNSVPNDWWGGNALGARRFSSSLPVLAIGLAALFTIMLRKRILKVLTALIVIAALLWNFALISIYTDKTIPHSGEIDYSYFLGSTFTRAGRIIGDIPHNIAAAAFVLTNKNASFRCYNVKLQKPETVIRTGTVNPYLRNGWSEIREDPGLGKKVRIAVRNIASINLYNDTEHVPLKIKVRLFPLGNTETVLFLFNSIEIETAKLKPGWQTITLSIDESLIQTGINLFRMDSFADITEEIEPIRDSSIGEWLEIEYIKIITKN